VFRILTQNQGIFPGITGLLKSNVLESFIGTTVLNMNEFLWILWLNVSLSPNVYVCALLILRLVILFFCIMMPRLKWHGLNFY